MRSAALLPLAFAVLCSPRPARADPPPQVSIRLAYTHGPGGNVCPPESMLHDELARRMGYDPFDSGGRGLLTVVVERGGRGFAARVERFDAAGASTWRDKFAVKGDDCEVLISRLATYLRALLEPVQGPPGAPARGPLFRVEPDNGAAPIAPAVSPPAAPPGDVRPVAFAPDRRRFELAADAHITLAGAPGVTGGATVRAGLRWPWFSVGVEGRFDAPASANATDVAGAPRAQYQARTFAGAIAPCAYYPNPHVQPFGCGVVAAGAVTAEASGVGTPTAGSAFVVATGPRVGLDIPMHPRLALRASFDALFFVRGARLHLVDSNVWKTPVVSGIGAIGLAVFL